MLAEQKYSFLKNKKTLLNGSVHFWRMSTSDMKEKKKKNIAGRLKQIKITGSSEDSQRRPTQSKHKTFRYAS